MRRKLQQVLSPTEVLVAGYVVTASPGYSEDDWWVAVINDVAVAKAGGAEAKTQAELQVWRDREGDMPELVDEWILRDFVVLEAARWRRATAFICGWDTDPYPIAPSFCVISRRDSISGPCTDIAAFVLNIRTGRLRCASDDVDNQVAVIWHEADLGGWGEGIVQWRGAERLTEAQDMEESVQVLQFDPDQGFSRGISIGAASMGEVLNLERIDRREHWPGEFRAAIRNRIAEIASDQQLARYTSWFRVDFEQRLDAVGDRTYNWVPSGGVAGWMHVVVGTSTSPD